MIPIFDITRQNRQLTKELDKTIKEVIDGGVFILGRKVAEFEKEFAKYLGVKYAVGVASGTDAISLALLAVGVERGDEVIMPANAYPTVFAVVAIGAMPKLVDVDPSTYNVDPAKISQAITKKTKAILPVHLYGQPADMGKILEVAKKFKIPVIEDCAQAVGAEIKYKGTSREKYLGASIKYIGKGDNYFQNTKYKALNTDSDSLNTKYQSLDTIGKRVGSIGDVGCFSFYPTKNLGCFGDGGMVVTNNEEIHKRIKLLRMYGEESRYQSVILGRNSRLDELQAAILLVKLKYLDKWNLQRRRIADLYFSHFFGRSKKWEKERAASGGFPISLTSGNREETSLKQSSTTPHLYLSARENTENTPMANDIQLPFEVSFAKHVYHLFVIRTKRRDELKKYLEEKGIQTAVHYPIPIHLIPSMKFLGHKMGDFPESERACEEILSLPMYPELTNVEVKEVIEEILRFYK